MGAISATIHGILSKLGFNKPITIVYSQETYCDTPRLFKYLANLHPSIQLVSIDVRESKAIVDLFEKDMQGKNVILFFESCSNPNGYIFDFSILPRLRAACQCLFTVVDNTWLTEVVFNPLQASEHVDIVLFSMTKYYSAGVAIGGAIVGNHKVMNDIGNWVRFNGQHTSPHNCKLTAENLPSMKDRITRSSLLTQQVVAYMAEQPKVVSVSHPSTQDHPSHKLALSYFNKENNVTLYPSVFTFKVKASKSKVLKVFKKAYTIEHKTSFGAGMSRTDPWPERDGDLMVCRMAIGFEDNFERITKGIDEIIHNL